MFKRVYCQSVRFIGKVLIAAIRLLYASVLAVKKPDRRLAVCGVLLFGVAFFAVHGRIVENYFAVVGESVFHTSLRVRMSMPQIASGKAHLPSNVLANLVYLDAANSFMPISRASQEEYDEGLGFYLDTLPSVQGVAFLESMSPATQELAGRSEVYTYVVEAGDTQIAISELFGISLDTLLWANGLTSRSIIRPGDTLTILPVNGIRYTVVKGDTVQTIAKKYNAVADDIVVYNNLPSDGTIVEGESIVIPGGIKPLPVVPKVSVQPTRVTRQTIQASQGWLVQPAPGRNWGRLHGFNGVDIANSCGTPIVAAAAGTVIVADDIGWNGGYGKYVKLQHLNGVITLYAHAKELLADVGVQVNQGETIALMGTTGRSTGCHVHFEVRGVANPFIRR